MAASNSWQAIGYKLLNTSAITAIAGSTQIWHGNKPEPRTGFPAINFFQISKVLMHNGVVEQTLWQISCRASKPADAMDLAQEVQIAFQNIQGAQDGFDLILGDTEAGQVIFEEDPDVYHVPVTVRVTYENG